MVNTYLLNDPAIWSSVTFLSIIAILYYLLCNKQSNNNQYSTLQGPLIDISNID